MANSYAVLFFKYPQIKNYSVFFHAVFFQCFDTSLEQQAMKIFCSNFDGLYVFHLRLRVYQQTETCAERVIQLDMTKYREQNTMWKQQIHL